MESGSESDDDTPDPPPKQPRLVPLATLYKGDCVDIMKRTDSNCIDFVLADPPYEKVIGAEWDQVPNYMDFARRWLTQAVRVLRPGGALIVYGSPERNWTARQAILLEDELNMNLVQHLVWCYTTGGGSRVSTQKKFAVQHEQLIWFEKPGGSRTFNAADGVEHYMDEDRAMALAKGKGRVSNESLDRGRPARSFFDFPRENSRSKERSYGTHPSMKPLALCEHLIKLHSSPLDTVLIPFAGSGSEMVSASELGRRVIGIEKETSYVEICKRRFEGHEKAIEVVDDVSLTEACVCAR